MKKKVLGVLALGVGVLALSSSSASADPIGTPQFRTLAGMGSATTSGVMNAIADRVVVGGVKVIASYDPTPAGALVQTKAAGCNIVRADGSTAGRNALTAAMTTGDPTFGCLDFARSSSTTVNANQTFVQMASDGLTYAYPTGGIIGSQTALADLKLIYSCDASVAGVFAPLIPQSGSGTRNDWATLMGISNTTLPSCVKDTNAGVAIQEHDGRVLSKANSLVPFSVAQWIAQSSGTLTDTRSGAQLGSIDSVTPLSQNPAQAKFRAVGNILPTSTFTNTASTGYTVFVNDGSGKAAVCTQAKDLLVAYGFAPAC
jgi:hypothetical protein